MHGLESAAPRTASPRPLLVRHPRRGDPVHDHGAGLCEVTRVAPNKVVGVWKDGRRGTFVEGKGYGADVEGEKGNGKIGKYQGYMPLVVEIAKFFKTGKPPVKAEETLEILAFMEAADESKRLDGKPVKLETVIRRAEQKLAAEKK